MSVLLNKSHYQFTINNKQGIMNTEDSLNIVKAFLEKVHHLFPEMSFRCEFRLENLTYIIEVKPFSFYKKNEKYGELEYDFVDEFDKTFPDYTIVFISDGSLIKIRKPIFEIGQKNANPKPEMEPPVLPAYHYNPDYLQSTLKY
jgi:hypothetical protein